MRRTQVATLLSAVFAALSLLIGARSAQAQTVTPSFATGLHAPISVVFDSVNNMYVANFDDNTIIKFPAPGGAAAGGAAGATFATGLDGPIGMVIDASSNLYVTNRDAGTVTGFPAAGGVVTGGVAGPAFAIGLNGPAGLVLDNANNLYVDNEGDGTITKFAAIGHVVTGGAAGAAFASGVGANPFLMAADPALNNLYVPDSNSVTGTTIIRVSIAPPPAPAPTLGTAAMVAFGLLTGAAGVLLLRRAT